MAEILCIFSTDSDGRPKAPQLIQGQVNRNPDQVGMMPDREVFHGYTPDGQFKMGWADEVTIASVPENQLPTKPGEMKAVETSVGDTRYHINIRMGRRGPQVTSIQQLQSPSQ